MSDFILMVKIMACIFCLFFGFFFGLIIGLTRKVDKAKLEIEAKKDKVVKSEKKILTYTGESDVTIDYSDFEGNVTNRNISIKYIYEENGKTYIRAFCHLRNEMRTFKIINILKIFIDGAEIAEPEIYFKNKIEDLQFIK